jgi:hypothetical protein
MLVGSDGRTAELIATTAFVPFAIDLPGGVPGTATLVGDRPGRIEVATDATSRQFLILAESYHEGWHVRIDGREQPTVRVDGDFLGCVVEPGRHRVTFSFHSWGFQYGTYLSCLGLLLASSVVATLLVADRFGISRAWLPRGPGGIDAPPGRGD